MKPQPTIRLREPKETGEDRRFKCPADVYGTDVTAAVLPRLYVSRQECACTHGCSRSICEIEKAWPRPGETAASELDPSLAGFIMRGFSGPGEVSDEPAKSPAPGEVHCESGGSFPVASWEFLVSD